MKKIILLFLSLIITSFVYSQSGWFWQNPLPNGNTYLSTCFINSQTGFTFGGCGKINKTTNSGITWFEVYSDPNRAFHSITFINNSTGFVGGFNGIVLKTTNSGFNWQNSGMTAGNFLNTLIKFRNSITGFIITGSGAIYRSTNSGTSWSQIYSTPTGDTMLLDICFLEDNKIICVGHYGRLLISTDSGNSWNVISSNTSRNLGCIFFVNNNTGYITGDDGIVLRTSNQGVTWNTVNIGATNNLEDVVFINENTGIILSYNKVYRTTNASLSWSSESLSVNLNGRILYHENNTVYTGGSPFYLYRSTDFGESWSTNYEGFKNTLNKVVYLDENTGIAAGYYGKYYRTTNGGNIWKEDSLNSDQHINDIDFLSDGISLMLTDSKIYKSTNNAENWNELFSEPNFNCNELYFINASSGFAVGNKIFRTTNGGVNWLKAANIQPQLIGYLVDVVFINELIGVAVGSSTSGSIIYRTSDGGFTWNGSAIGFYNLLNSVTKAGDSTLVVFSSLGNVIRSTNAGLNWVINDPIVNTGVQMQFINNTTGFLCGRSGSSMMKSTNSGLNWFAIQGPCLSIDGFYFLNENTGTVISYVYGSIMKTTTGGNPIGIETISEEIPVQFLLSQNYPNPFNPSTKIKFSIPATGQLQQLNTKLVIYDMLGKEAAILVNEQLKPGIYEVNWDAGFYPSGVYFYKLIAGDYTETKKMVLVK
jgi:photosystem II stability/assembly factor-like uncharacterized protein